MNKIAKLKGIVSLAVVICWLGVSMEDSHAADCKALRNQANEETSLLKKRNLLKKAVVQCPRDPQLNYSYAKTLERLRKYEEALKYYTVASRFRSTKAESFFGMGDIYLILSKPDKAAIAYEKGLRIDPKNERALNSLKEIRGKHKLSSTIAVPPPPPPPAQPVVKPEKSVSPPAPAPTVVEKGPDLKLQTPFTP